MSDSFSQLYVTTALGGQLMGLLMAPDIEPGSDPGYQLCKTLYLYHPLGRKMAEAPLTLALAQRRTRVVQDAPNEVMEEFDRVWDLTRADMLVKNVFSLARIYGLATLVVLVEGEKADKPLDPWKIWDKRLSFNVLDPLNTSGSLVLTQVPTSPDFAKPVTVRANGLTFHPSRFDVVMNEQPLYIAYTSSAFGFVGRSVYQRALYPLKSFIRSMIADDMIATKLGLLVAKQKKASSVIDNVMLKVAGAKRALLQQAQTGQVLSIDVEEAIETLNMMNVDGAGKYSRENILKNVATAADMPAVILENETMVAGFGEGTEDAKNIARYVEGVRKEMEPSYAFLEPLAMHRAWNPNFYARIQTLYPDRYQGVSYEDAFTEWRDNYHAEWPSFLIEPESEQVNVEKIKNESIVAVAQTLLDKLDPENQVRVMQWLVDNVQENKRLFPHEVELDWDAAVEHAEEQAEQAQAAAEAGGEDDTSVAKKAGSFGMK